MARVAVTGDATLDAVFPITRYFHYLARVFVVQVSVNPEYKIPEMTFTNNAAVCSVYYSESFVKIHDCVVQNP